VGDTASQRQASRIRDLGSWIILAGTVAPQTRRSLHHVGTPAVVGGGDPQKAARDPGPKRLDHGAGVTA
jgi:hypothetical protein